MSSFAVLGKGPRGEQGPQGPPGISAGIGFSQESFVDDLTMHIWRGPTEVLSGSVGTMHGDMPYSVSPVDVNQFLEYQQGVTEYVVQDTINQGHLRLYVSSPVSYPQPTSSQVQTPWYGQAAITGRLIQCLDSVALVDPAYYGKPVRRAVSYALYGAGDTVIGGFTAESEVTVRLRGHSPAVGMYVDDVEIVYEFDAASVVLYAVSDMTGFTLDASNYRLGLAQAWDAGTDIITRQSFHVL